MDRLGTLADEPLDAHGEAEWRRLRAQLELVGSHFWLGFVFSPSPRSVMVLRGRAERLLRELDRDLLLIRPESPDKLRAVLPVLIESLKPAQAGCTWIEAVRTDVPGKTEQPWTTAWSDLFLRTNERRDTLRSRLTGGLMFAATPSMKPRVRDAAPDLWSVRGLVLDLSPLHIDSREHQKDDSVAFNVYSMDPSFALSEAKRLEGVGATRSRAYALLRAAEGMLSMGRSEEAWEQAKLARDLLSAEDPFGAARALILLAEAQEMRGNFFAARRYVEQAIALRQGATKGAVPREWFERAGRLSHQCGDDERSEAEFAKAKSIALERGRESETPALLHGLGDARLGQGDVSGASAAFWESLTIARRVYAQGDTPQASQDLAAWLSKIGDALHDTGDIAGALAVFEESVGIHRQLSAASGNDPGALRNLSIALNRLGNTQLDAGDLDAATRSFEEALALRRQLSALSGESPRALRDLASSLTKVGDARRSAGDLAGASAAFEESLAIDRRVCEQLKQTPSSLRDLLVSLDRVAKVRRDAGDLAGAIACHEARVNIADKLVAAEGGSKRAKELRANAVAELEAVRQAPHDEASVRAAFADLRRDLAI